MIITDIIKVNKAQEHSDFTIAPECREQYQRISEVVLNRQYKERDYKFLLENWLEQETLLGIKLSINPSTVGNKKGKMTKEIERLLPRRLVKRLNEVNEQIIICHINNEEIPTSVMESLDDITDILNINEFKAEYELPVIIKQMYDKLKGDFSTSKRYDDNVKSLSIDQISNIVKSDNRKLKKKQESYTLLDLQPILSQIALYSNKAILTDLLELDQDKLYYSLDLIYNQELPHNLREEAVAITNALDGLISSVVDTSSTSTSAGGTQHGVDSDNEIISETY